METQDSQDKDDSKVEKHPKQDFQVERLAFFSDAVFAIAITLLAVEFKIPRITDDTTFDDALKQLLDLKYLFFATLLSFLLISNYWRNHHILFKYIHNYNNKLITVNMLVLLPIIFFPFTTAFVAESLNSLFENGKVYLDVYFLGFRLFLLNHFFASLMCYIFYWYALVKHKELSYTMPAKEKLNFLINTWFVIIIFAAIFIAAFFHSLFFIDLIVILGFLVRAIIKRRLKKRLMVEDKITKSLIINH